MEGSELPWTWTWCVSERAEIGLILHPPLGEESGQRIVNAYASSDSRVIREDGRSVMREELNTVRLQCCK